jgi:hypothetical protein
VRISSKVIAFALCPRMNAPITPPAICVSRSAFTASIVSVSIRE